MLEQRLERIRQKLDRLQKMDSQHRVFGSQGHSYKLASPYKESYVVAFEREHSITLPEDYRAFITQLGSCGAGPSYGLLDFYGAMQQIDNRYGPHSLSTPFLHTGIWNPMDEINFNLPLPPGLAQLEKDYVLNKHIDGAMPICHEGCGHYVLLVVSGQERGHIWGDSRVSDGGIYPYLFSSTPENSEPCRSMLAKGTRSVLWPGTKTGWIAAYMTYHSNLPLSPILEFPDRVGYHRQIGFRGGESERDKSRRRRRLT